MEWEGPAREMNVITVAIGGLLKSLFSKLSPWAKSHAQDSRHHARMWHTFCRSSSADWELTLLAYVAPFAVPMPTSSRPYWLVTTPEIPVQSWKRSLTFRYLHMLTPKGGMANVDGEVWVI